MKFYIATRLENHALHNIVRDRLQSGGFGLPKDTITYDWTSHGSVQREGHERIREVALAETKGVVDADYVVVLLPGGRGTHVELGMALALGKPVLLYGVDEDFGDTGRTVAFWGECLCAEIDPTDRPCVVCSERGGIGWVILGGESGSGASDCRPCSAEWIRDAARVCVDRGVPVFVKQLGGRYYDVQHGVVGKHAIAEEMEVPFGYRRLADSHGGDPTEWPTAFPREFPAWRAGVPDGR